MNRDVRKRELVKITIENYKMMQRLKNIKPFYQKKEWQTERRRNQAYIENISFFSKKKMKQG